MKTRNRLFAFGNWSDCCPRSIFDPLSIVATCKSQHLHTGLICLAPLGVGDFDGQRYSLLSDSSASILPPAFLLWGNSMAGLITGLPTTIHIDVQPLTEVSVCIGLGLLVNQIYLRKGRNILIGSPETATGQSVDLDTNNAFAKLLLLIAIAVHLANYYWAFYTKITLDKRTWALGSRKTTPLIYSWQPLTTGTSFLRLSSSCPMGLWPARYHPFLFELMGSVVSGRGDRSLPRAETRTRYSPAHV